MAFDIADLLRKHEGQFVELLNRHINPSFASVLKTIGYDVNYVRGKGAYLYDDRGQRYIDCLGGYAVFATGRNHPVIRQALKDAMDLDTPNLPGIGPFRTAGILAQELLTLVPGELDTVYFANSGTEGNEVAIKYARAATGRDRILYCGHAYHGLTNGSLSINGNPEFREGFGSLLPHTTEIPFNDLPALERELAAGDVAAFIVEPIQGKGVNLPDDAYFAEVSRLCRAHGSLLVLDEVQTGFGRTGKMFAANHWNIEPDIMVVAKALSGGYIPVCAVISKRWIHSKVFSSMDRCSVQQVTFSMNELAMVAGLATLHVIKEEKIVENAAAVGEYLLAGLRSLMSRHEMIKEVRGKGLMIAIEFGPPKSRTLRFGWNLLHKMDQSLFCQAILMPLLTDHHILAQVAGHHMDVIKLIPPLVLTQADADDIIKAFDATIGACHKFPGPAWAVGTKLGKAAMKRVWGSPKRLSPAT
jgi:ornithine--oxo-acid transaminase